MMMHGKWWDFRKAVAHVLIFARSLTGLQQIVRFAEEYSTFISKFMREYPSFPLAISLLNVTYVLCFHLSIHDKGARFVSPYQNFADKSASKSQLDLAKVFLNCALSFTGLLFSNVSSTWEPWG